MIDSAKGIKSSEKCIFCKHFSVNVNDLWLLINDWFAELGFIDYNLSDSRRVIEYLENGPILNTMIHLTKKVIRDSFKLERLLSIFHIKYGVKITIILKNTFTTQLGKATLRRKVE